MRKSLAKERRPKSFQYKAAKIYENLRKRRSRLQGCVASWLYLRCSGGTAERRETACRRQPAGRCKASATPLRVLPPPSRLGQAKNPAATRHFVIFSRFS